MKTVKKSVALLSAFVLFLSAVCFSSYASYGDTAKRQTLTSLENLSTAKTGLFYVLKDCARVVNFITKKNFLPDNNLDVEFDEGTALDLCNFIYENSDLDIVNLLGNIPLGAKGMKFVYKLTNADTTEIRNALYRIRDKCDENGQGTLSLIFYFLGSYLSGIDKVNVYTVPYKNDGSVQVEIMLTYLDGNTEKVKADIYFSEDGLAYGDNGRGILGLGYECSVYELLIYATVNSWMRNFGFCDFYDFFCYTTPFFNYLTRRFKFEYDGKEWMIQIWKGNYVITNGGEIGIYSRDKGTKESFYNCYDGVMNMEMKLSKGDNVIFERSGEHWWLSGFKLGKELYAPKDMTLEFSIDFPNREMAEAFENSVNQNIMQDTLCKSDGNRITVVW